MQKSSGVKMHAIQSVARVQCHQTFCTIRESILQVEQQNTAEYEKEKKHSAQQTTVQCRPGVL